MIRTFGAAILGCLAFAVGLFVMWPPSGASDGPVRDTVRPRLATEALLAAPPGSDYDAVFAVSAVSAALRSGSVAAGTTGTNAAPPLRLYCDVLDEGTYLAVDCYPDGTRLGIGEAGLFEALGSFPSVRGPDGAWPQTLRLRRRWPMLELVADGRRVFRTVVDGFPEGRIGLGLGVDASSEEALPLVQPVDPIVFLDDFMREPGHVDDWRPAGAVVWRIRGLENPARSSNAFVYEAEGPGRGASLVGRADWTDYRVGVAALGRAGGALGLVLSAGETATGESLPDRACIVRWSAETAAGDEEDSAGGVLQIVERAGGVERILVERAGGYRPGQWYRIAARLLDGRVTVAIDGHERLSAASPVFSGGRTGLWAEGTHPAEFDDVEVLSLRETPGGEGSPRWLFVGPGWTHASGGAIAKVQPALRTFAITGRPDWRDVRLRAEVSGRGAPAGLVASWRDPGTYLALLQDPAHDLRRLVRVENGIERVLDEERITDRGAPLALRIDRGVVRAGALAAFVPDLPAGRVGVLAGPGANGGELMAERVRVADFHAEVVPPPQPEVTANEVFDEELLMAAWSGGGGDWRPGTPPAGYDRAWWHRAYFFGDVEMEAELPAEMPAGWTLGLSLAKPELAREEKNGYVLLADVSPVGGVLALQREGVAVARMALEETEAIRRIRFRRAGPFLLVYLDDRLRLHWRDPQPLAGALAAWTESGLDLPPASVRMVSRRQINDAFNSAPADWRQAGGVWQVTNRWECDTRWSFMAGMPPSVVRRRIAGMSGRSSADVWLRETLADRLALLPSTTSEVAALWHKRTIGGAVAVDCFVGPLHQRSDGNYSHTAKNFCVVLGGDGHDLSTGYTFILAGWENSRSAILKNGEVVAQQEGGIPQVQGLHRRWLHLRASQQDGLVEFTGAVQISPHTPEQVFVRLAYSDPAPIPEGQVAVWTYDAGMLVARLRVSAETIGPMEDPFVRYPDVSPCLFAPDAEVVSR